MNDIHEAPFAAEAEERWGGTEPYRESKRRTSAYGPEDWKRIHGQMETIEAAFAEAMASGAEPDGERATDLAEEARLHIDRWYYPCSREMHARLSDMYTADARFRAHYDERAEGLAEYVSAAIKANGGRSQA